MLVIVIEALLDRGTSTTIADGFKEGKEKAEVSLNGIFNSLPLVFFSYMYQANIPAIYTELEKPSMSSITKVLAVGTILAAIGYIFAGMFGYVAFAAGETRGPARRCFCIREHSLGTLAYARNYRYSSCNLHILVRHLLGRSFRNSILSLTNQGFN